MWDAQFEGIFVVAELSLKPHQKFPFLIKILSIFDDALDQLSQQCELDANKLFDLNFSLNQTWDVILSLINSIFKFMRCLSDYLTGHQPRRRLLIRKISVCLIKSA